MFEGLAIWEEEKYRNLQGTYPVISLSFANIKENTYENTKQKIYQVLVDVYEEHIFLLKEGLLDGTEADFFRSVHMDMKETTATQALQIFIALL